MTYIRTKSLVKNLPGATILFSNLMTYLSTLIISRGLAQTVDKFPVAVWDPTGRYQMTQKKNLKQVRMVI